MKYYLRKTAEIHNQKFSKTTSSKNPRIWTKLNDLKRQYSLDYTKEDIKYIKVW